MKPTTKAKQRDFLDTLIDNIDRRSMARSDLLRALRTLRNQLHNRPALRGRVSAPATATQQLRIVQLHKRHPQLSMQEISHQLGISIGRVSETLRGKRK